MTTQTLKLHDPRKRLPKGWYVRGSAGAHRDQHAVLIKRKPRKAARQGGQSEFALHCQVATYLARALTSMETWWTTIPAGGGGRIRGARLKRMGYKAGTPDILIVHQGMCHWIELKRAKGGRISEVQDDVRYYHQLAGCRSETCRSLQEVYDVLCRWQMPVSASPT